LLEFALAKPERSGLCVGAMKTTISNEFTGYRAVVRHTGATPAVATLRKHLGAAKASGCRSVSQIVREDGVVLALANFGRGWEVADTGRRARWPGGAS
jgi:hypothetical protein